MDKDSAPTFLTRVKDEMHLMHPTERRLAEFLLSFPGELASYSATELATLANVSNATVTRVIKKLGYSSYDEARRQVRTDGRTGGAIYMVGSKTQQTEGLMGSHITQSKANLENTFATTSLKEIDQLAQSILSARRVWIVAFRTSVSFASYFQWQILQIVENVSVIPRSGQTLAEHLAGMGSEDCVIFFGLQRNVSGSKELLELIQNAGPDVALITDANLDRHKDVRWHFRCETIAPGPLFNHVAVMGLLHLVAVRVIELAGPAGRKRLTKIESLHESLKEI